MDIAEFDAIATSYDDDFTESSIGSLQRMQVYACLDPILKALSGKKILDLGCGTGEDAIYLAQKKFLVTGIDQSKNMMNRAQQKAEHAGLLTHITFHQLSIESLEQLPAGARFDLIFSDFGPLNCIAPERLPKLAKSIYDRLEPGGHLAVVMMNRFCLWESLYFTLKGSWSKIFRRSSKKGIKAPLGNNVFIQTWYHSPAGFHRSFRKHFSRNIVRPIGFFVPPSYISRFNESRYSGWINILSYMDRHNPFLKLSAFASDHFFIHMIKKQGESI